MAKEAIDVQISDEASQEVGSLRVWAEIGDVQYLSIKVFLRSRTLKRHSKTIANAMEGSIRPVRSSSHIENVWQRRADFIIKQICGK